MIRRTTRSRAVAAAAALVLATACVSGAVSGAAQADAPAPAASSGAGSAAHPWRITDTPEHVGRGQLVACATATRCFALTHWRHFLSWTGGAWNRKGVRHLVNRGFYYDTLACASSKFCVVAGGREVDRWNGHVWARVRTVDPNFYPSETSCVAPTFCLTVGGMYPHNQLTYAAFLLNGKLTQTKNLGKLAGFDSISCTSRTFCLIEGFHKGPTGWGPMQDVWNGTKVVHIPAPPDSMHGLSCSSRTFCIAVGSIKKGVRQLWEWHGVDAGWTSLALPQATDETIDPWAVDCLSKTMCEMVGRRNPDGPTGGKTAAWRWDGSGWTEQTMPSAPGHQVLRSVDCASASVCTAVGYVGKHALTMTTAS